MDDVTAEPSDLSHLIVTLLRGFYWLDEGLQSYVRAQGWPVITRPQSMIMASIEMGSNWVPWLFQSFKRSYGQEPSGYDGDPRDTFRKHIWISPFHEDDVPLLRDLIGADRMIMGSDYPHAEGLAVPTDYVHELADFSPEERRFLSS